MSITVEIILKQQVHNYHRRGLMHAEDVKASQSAPAAQSIEFTFNQIVWSETLSWPLVPVK